MNRVTRLLFGFRDDIDLNQKWWHRAFKVLFLICLLPAIGLIGVIAEEELSPEPIPSNLRMVSLDAFLKQSSKDVANVVPGFLALDGRLGQIVGGSVQNIEYRQSDIERYLLCTPDGYLHAKALVEFVNADGSGEKETVETLTAKLRSAGGEDGPRFCLKKEDQSIPPQLHTSPSRPVPQSNRSDFLEK